MHMDRFGAPGGLTVLVMVAGSACATSGIGNADSFPSDAASDRGTSGDSSLFPLDSADPESGVGLFSDAPGSFGDDTGSPGSSSGGGGQEGGTGNDAGDAEAGVTSSTGLSVLYQVQNSAPMSAYIGCELSVTNSGSTPVALSNLEARYYFIGKDTNGVAVTPQVTINWSHVSTSGADANLTVTYAVNPLQPPASSADTYVAFDFSGTHSTLAPGESAVFSWQLQGPDPSKDIYAQTSDYSFNASLTSLTPWAHVPLFQSGSIVWGTPP